MSGRHRAKAAPARRAAWVLLFLSAPWLPSLRAQPAPPRLLIALASFRDRPLHPRVYFYEHDGVASGQPAGGVETVNLVVDTRPSLALGGRLCATAAELENNPSDIRLWDAEGKKELPSPPGLKTETPEISPALSEDGRWLAFAAWRREGGRGGWDLFLYDLREKKAALLPCSGDEEEQWPSLSGDGRLVAYTCVRPGGSGRSDVYVFDRQEGKHLLLPGLNTAYRELDPCLSADGRFLAFSSDRPGGAGTRDVYLYDLRAGALVALPGLNGVGPEQTPSLTADGRFLACVAERASGEGERDVLLYDRQAARLLPTPGLNTRAEDFDPAICYRPR